MDAAADYLRYYPAVGFHFQVTFGTKNEDDGDGRFQSVAGLSVEVETESKKEGGENRFEHALPIRSRYPLLVLKRGLIQSKALRKWCLDSINAVSTLASANPSQRLITPKDLTISLLGPENEILMTWKVVHAWPKKWSVTDFNAEQSSIVIESIELQYQYFTINDLVNAH
jgi:phage tail-like protein